MNLRTLTITIWLLLVVAMGTALAQVVSFIGVKSYPPQLMLTFSNLPPVWTLEATRDLTNWFDIIHSGTIAPPLIELGISNTAHAQFYRIR